MTSSHKGLLTCQHRNLEAKGKRLCQLTGDMIPERNEECTGHWSTQREWVFNLDSRRFAYLSLKNIDNLDYRTFPLVMPINSKRQLASCEVLVASVVFNSVTLLWYSSQKVQWHGSGTLFYYILWLYERVVTVPSDLCRITVLQWPSYYNHEISH